MLRTDVSTQQMLEACSKPARKRMAFKKFLQSLLPGMIAFLKIDFFRAFGASEGLLSSDV
jgi:hypothetical protein